MAELSPLAQKIADEKPRFWEHKLFAQVLLDEIAPWAEERAQHRAGEAPGPKEPLTPRAFPRWIQLRMEEQIKFMEPWAKVVLFLRDASFGSSGRGKDEFFMVDLARELGTAYTLALHWAQRFRRLNLPALYQPALHEYAVFPENLLQAIETLPGKLLARLQEIESPDYTGPMTIELKVDIEPHNLQKVEEETQKLIQRLSGSD